MNIGIDIGGSHIGIGIVDDNMQLILKKEHNWTIEEKKDFFRSIEIYSKKLINESIQETNGKIKKIGIGFPCANIVDGRATIDKETINLSDILSKEFNVPVYLKNDVKCSAICEKTIGNLKDYDNCIFVTLGTGIGGAYFYKNELVVPNTYQGFEMGHMVIDYNGKQCKCGRVGCFEQYASMRAFRKDIEELFGIENLNSYKMFEIIESKEKEEEVNQIIDKFTDYLVIGFSNLINIFEPDVICIGGSFTYYSSLFMEKIEKKIKENFKNREIPKLTIAKFENDAGIIGASMLNSN